jgi:hypothetical protein
MGLPGGVAVRTAAAFPATHAASRFDRLKPFDKLRA